MLRWKPWLGSDRRLLSLFLAAAVLLGGTLLWLGWQLVQQDGKLADQRLQERREIAADLAVAALQKSLAQAEEQLTGPPDRAMATAATLPIDSALIVDSGAAVQSYPARRLAFYPVQPPRHDPPAAQFDAADRLELQRQDYPRALDALRTPAQSTDSATRAAALMRIARIRRKEKQGKEALAAYEAMLRLQDARVEGVPAELIARQQRLAIFRQDQRSEEAGAEATELLRALNECRYTLTRGVYEFYLQEAQAVLGATAVGANVALAAAAEELHSVRPVAPGESGRLTVHAGSQATLVLWRTRNAATIALLLGPSWLQGHSLAGYGTTIRLTDPSGHTVLGAENMRRGRESLRLAAATQLPWNVHAVIADPDAALAADKRRQNLVIASMAALTALILAGSFLIGRTVTRELALSRLQSDFVAAVSHEFRTPLTSLCLLSEHLATGRVAGERERQEYFETLARESQRLRRLVEGLLNFGRMEAGEAEYRFETVDPAELVQSVSLEFEHDSEARGHRIEVYTREDTPLIRADRAALACAVWNLIDNAVKYSPECPTVWADVERSGAFAAIRIRDRGIGIPASEQSHVFDKFVRGEAAKQGSIRGTGVGLAMVQQIVSAHGGDVQLESKRGEGSAFTMRLPAVN